MPIEKNHSYPVEVIVWNIRSCFNVGSFFRTADAAGVRHIYLCGYTPTPPDPKISKVALGAETTVPFSHHARLQPLLKRLRKQDYCIVSVEKTNSSIPYTFWKRPQKPIALILGNEVLGVPKTICDSSDATIHIPMRGKKESLNVSVAFGIIAYGILPKPKTT